MFKRPWVNYRTDYLTLVSDRYLVSCGYQEVNPGLGPFEAFCKCTPDTLGSQTQCGYNSAIACVAVSVGEIWWTPMQ